MKHALLAAAIAAIVLPGISFAQEREERVVVEEGEKDVVIRRTDAPDHDGLEVKTLKGKTEEQIHFIVKGVQSEAQKKLDELAEKIRSETKENRIKLVPQMVDLYQSYMVELAGEPQRKSSASSVRPGASYGFGVVKKLESMEKASFLGIGAAPIPPAVRQQVKLPRGVGVLVDSIEKGSPAESAGVQRYDVLHKVGDQLLVNAHQLAVLIRSYEPGEDVKLTVIQGGEPKTLTAKLVEREVRALDDASPWGLRPGELLESPAGDRVKIRDFREVRGWPGLGASAGAISSRVTSDGLREFEMRDPEYRLTLNVRPDKEIHLRADGPSGKPVFDGPVSTKEQREKLPKEIEQRVQGLERLPLVGRLFEADGTTLVLTQPDPSQGVAKENQVELFLGHRVTLRREGGRTIATIRDAEGRQVFDGPVDTPADLHSLPGHLRELADSDRWQATVRRLREAEPEAE